MQKKIKIAAVQMKSIMKDTGHNLSKAINFIQEAALKGANIVCLPELFYSGYHLNKEEFFLLAERSDGPMYQVLSKVAKEKGVYILASFPEKADLPGVIYNSSMLINDKGSIAGNMRKVYLWGKEKLIFREGDRFPVFDTPLGKIGILICYDAEFPEPVRIMALKGAQLILIPSVWSLGAKHRWDIDLTAGALYNLLFIAGINTIGDGACGNSKVVSPRGEILIEASVDREEIIYCDIDLGDVEKTRMEIPYMQDFKHETFSMDALNKF